MVGGSSDFCLRHGRDAVHSSSSEGEERFLSCPQSGPPSGKPQYWLLAATALLCLAHSSSNESDMGHVNRASTRRIYASSMSNSSQSTSQVGLSSTALPVSCLWISITTCFWLKSQQTCFCRFSCRLQHRLWTLCSWSSSISCRVESLEPSQ